MRKNLSLNDGWLFAEQYAQGMEQIHADESAFCSVRLPHTNRELPLNHFDERESQLISCYRRQIRVAPRAGKRVFLHFEGVMAAATVFFNGEQIAQHLGGYTPFTCELTQLLTGGDDVLAVVADATERSDIPPFGYVIDYLTYGGIYREVWLEETSEVFIQNAQVKPAKTEEGWQVETDVFLDNLSGASGAGELVFTLSNSQGEVKQHTQNISLNGEKNQKISVSFAVGDVRLWDLDEPNLYDLSIKRKQAEEEIDDYACRVGFREACFTPEGFFLNGKRVKIRGLNRHQSFPYVGYAMPKRAQERDAELLKHDLGVNLVRTSHYPQSIHFLNRCDELGLLVFEEFPGWQHIGNDVWKKNAVHTLEEMITRDWNHPSIVLWGVRINESQDDDAFYRETNALAYKLDATRQTGGVRNFEGSHLFEDVYTYNDFVHSGENRALKPRKEVARASVPYLVTEHNGHMYPTKKFDCEEKRVEHALRHIRVLNSAYGANEISGAVGWCMSDYNTHKDFGSGDKICYHGVMDMFRLPKFAASAYRSQQDSEIVMEVASGMNQGERNGSNMTSVHVFTNCDSVRLYKNGAYIGESDPDCKTYPNLPHPPVVMTDFIGELMAKNEGFAKQDAERIKHIFAAIVKYGDKSLPLRYKLSMGFIMLKLHLTYQDAVDLYTKYVAGWGSESTEFLFEGYRAGKLVASVTRGASVSTELRVTPDTLTLEEGDTYDVCRVVIEHMDQFGMVLPYSVEVARVTVSGAGERIGPELLPLLGGSAAFWVRTTGEGEITVRVESERFAPQERKLNVTRKKDG
ncbi:MAG: glycoside hydrolase family 2 TIM barrel-domain containing protein [Eubacteriales bacterium]|nr:glycoside hydrolase family 2 TIM barrel-domain containing protein [Eubacteriales bacterium]